MVDGILIIEIQDKDNFRLKELNWVDFRLQDVEYFDYGGLEDVIQQLHQDIKDSLLLVTFKYSAKSWLSYEGEWDCEEFVNVVSHQILKENYKELNREMTTEEIKFYDYRINGFESLVEEDNFKNHKEELLVEWEDFYGEKFIPSKPKESEKELLFKNL